MISYFKKIYDNIKFKFNYIPIVSISKDSTILEEKKWHKVTFYIYKNNDDVLVDEVRIQQLKSKKCFNNFRFGQESITLN